MYYYRKQPVCSQLKTVPKQSIKYSYVFIYCTMNRSLPNELQKINYKTKEYICFRTEIKNASSCTHIQNKSETNLGLDRQYSFES